MKRIIFIGIAFMLGSMGAKSQTINTVLDGAYVPEHTQTKRVVPYPYLRESDVMWSKKIWRTLDLREKLNHPLYFPLEELNDRNSLFTVIKNSLVVDGSITAYGLGPTLDDDEFKYPLAPSQVDSILNPTITLEDEDLLTGEITYIETSAPIESELVTQYQLKEHWVFDKQRSERYVRIIGICPRVEVYDQTTGDFRGFKPLFWLYYPECRYVFQNAWVFNPGNGAERRSFEEIFQKRRFASFIHKEDNVYDRPVASYALGIDALLEAERIKSDLFLIEHDLWHY